MADRADDEQLDAYVPTAPRSPGTRRRLVVVGAVGVVAALLVGLGLIRRDDADDSAAQLSTQTADDRTLETRPTPTTASTVPPAPVDQATEAASSVPEPPVATTRPTRPPSPPTTGAVEVPSDEPEVAEPTEETVVTEPEPTATGPVVPDGIELVVGVPPAQGSPLSAVVNRWYLAPDGRTYGALPIGVMPGDPSPDFVVTTYVVGWDRVVAGYIRREHTIMGTPPQGPEGTPVYANDGTTLVGHILPDIQFVPLASRP